MGGCFSKNNKKQQKKDDDDDDDDRGIKGEKTTSASRDPPPTASESESHQEEEKVKEVLSETPKLITANNNKNAHSIDHKKKESSDLDLDNIDRGLKSSQVISEGLSAASTTTLAADAEAEAEKKMKMKMRSSSITSPSKIQKMMGNIRSDQLQYRQTTTCGGRREMMTRGVVDVGCRSGRSSPSPMNRNRLISSSSSSSNFPSSYYYSNSSNGSSNGNVVINYKGSDINGERRSLSPAAINRRGQVLQGATMDQRECSSSKMMKANGRRSPPPHQRITPPPARVVDLGELAKKKKKKMGQDINAAAEDGINLDASKEKESLDNPLVSMECFIFL